MSLVSFCTTQYEEKEKEKKNTWTLDLLMERFEIIMTMCADILICVVFTNTVL